MYWLMLGLAFLLELPGREDHVHGLMNGFSNQGIGHQILGGDS